MKQLSVILLLLILGTAVHTQNITLPEGRPMIMPVAGQPGPDTWLFGQAYGNTTGAFNFGDQWYRAGQGLHFGVDFSMPCGTPLVAVADGTIQFVDDMGFGSAPHNLIIRHDAIGVTTLYGHLFDTPPVSAGQFVQQGEVVGYSGDPDETCASRPHLHFEIRSLDYSRTMNPVNYIDANWHSLALIGPFGYPLFQQNLANPRQWITLADQPDVYFWGTILNRYDITYPAAGDMRPAPSPELIRTAEPLAENPTYTRYQLTNNGCCANAYWHPSDPNRLYTMDGDIGARANVYEWTLPNAEQTPVSPAPPPYLSANGAYSIEPFINGFSKIRRFSDNAEFTLDTGGRLPTLNPSGTHVMWTSEDGRAVPGQARPYTRVFISILDGGNPVEVFANPGLNVQWIDDTRVLFSQRDEQRITSLYVYMMNTGSVIEVGRWREMRGLDVSPGGRYIAFYITWQDDPAENGVYIVDISQPINPIIMKMPWFGGWRWRDSESIYYVPFDPRSQYHTLRLYDLANNSDLPLIGPDSAAFTIADGHWDVSADGTRVLYQDAADRNLYILEPAS